MNITVKVDDVTLDTVVAEGIAYSEDGDPYRTTAGNATIADLVAAQITERLTKEDAWGGLKKRASEIRAEAIREAIRPQLEEALAAPFHKTNSYGEPVGEPTTMRELVISETRTVLNAPADQYNRDRGTMLTKAIRDEVKKALAAEIGDAVKLAREQVSGEIGQQVAAAVSAAMRAK